jgi:hypothetical protein
MLCSQNTRIFLNIFENFDGNMQIRCTEDSAYIRGGEFNTPRPSLS